MEGHLYLAWFFWDKSTGHGTLGVVVISRRHVFGRPMYEHGSSMWQWAAITVVAFVVAVVTAEDVAKMDCLVNHSKGFSDPKNVYQCRAPLKCCFEYSKPSCCGSKPFWQILKEQFALWGGLFAILLTIASIVYCRKNDINLPACVAFKACLIRCCCGATGANEQRVETITFTEKLISQNGSGQHLLPALPVRKQPTGWRNNSVNPIQMTSTV